MPRYIDAEALDNRIKAEWAKQVDETKGYYGLAHFFVETQPTADVAPVVHAHWDGYSCSRFLGWKNGDARWADGKYYYCSLCRRRTVIRENYCPHCGAKMDEETEN